MVSQTVGYPWWNTQPHQRVPLTSPSSPQEKETKTEEPPSIPTKSTLHPSSPHQRRSCQLWQKLRPSHYRYINIHQPYIQGSLLTLTHSSQNSPSSTLSSKSIKNHGQQDQSYHVAVAFSTILVSGSTRTFKRSPSPRKPTLKIFKDLKELIIQLSPLPPGGKNI